MGNSFSQLQLIVFLAITFVAWACFSYGSTGVVTFKRWFGDTAENRLNALYLFVDGNKVFFYFAFGIVIVPAVLWFLSGSVPIAVIVLLVVMGVPRFGYYLMRKKFISDLENALPDALAQMAGSMRVGTSLPGAIDAMVSETKGPLSKEFTQVLKETRVGVPFEDALNNLDRRVESENLSLVIAATNISREVGGNLGETFERMGEMLRQKLSLEARINALTSQGKLQGIVVGLLPVAICLVMFYMEPETMAYMTGSLAGWIWMLIIAVLLGAGGFMIHKIVNIDV